MTDRRGDRRHGSRRLLDQLEAERDWQPPARRRLEDLDAGERQEVMRLVGEVLIKIAEGTLT